MRAATWATAAGLLLGLVGPAAAQPLSGTESSGCSGSTFAVDEFPNVPLDAGTATTLLTVTVPHPCPGPLFLRGTVVAFLSPLAVEGALVSATATLTCVGGGCQAPGAEIVAAPGSLTTAVRPPGATATAATITLPLTAVFPDLPPGTYDLRVQASGVNASAVGVEVHVLDAGGPAGGARPAAP
jgi:hypothetical protein